MRAASALGRQREGWHDYRSGQCSDPLLGMGLLYGHELNVQGIEGGSVLIRTLLLA